MNYYYLSLYVRNVTVLFFNKDQFLPQINNKLTCLWQQL